MNLNELEASETNFEQLRKMGLRLTNTDSASIAGSAEAALEILEWGSEHLASLNMHYCSARFKDSVQLRNRLERRLKETIRDLEERDDTDPLVVLGVIRGAAGTVLTPDQLQLLYQTLYHELGVPSNLINLDTSRNRIEIAPWILEDIHVELESVVGFAKDLEIGLAYEYPTYDRLQTLFEPL
jgi:hypothetical protein